MLTVGLEHYLKKQELNIFLFLTFYTSLKNSSYISLNVFKILTFYLRYQN